MAESTAKKVTKAKPTGGDDLKALLEAGVHFGHQTRRWNPKMAEYIFTARNGVHVLDLTKTAVLLEVAVKFVRETTANGGQILFVGTKRQAKAIVEAAARDAGMPFVTQRWLGGMITNLETIKARINRLKKLENIVAEENFGDMTKKEKLDMTNEIAHLNRIFGGIREMNGVPAAIFVVDMPREDIAIKEAHKLGIPVIATVDTNADPDQADFIIPSNDDAIGAIKLITQKIADAAKDGAAEYNQKVTSKKTEE